ncbi:MBL fold metallo-hydrolase [Telluribacter sp.]|jgi:glyoxylase-like metal-dependent hydrolase (beta-lactamase superfamily II)|uniref:MBL fold metallo-hydrolase n=1 Tax=Telluribacter sp. TaxID=1978767 RepID=UPI002E123298|nr:MBL fold metallo-hydrolase [Telluribacter sp.]
MQRRHFIQTTALSLGATLLTGKELLAGILAEDPYKMKDLRGGVGIFTERGGTIAYLINKQGMVVVDSQFPEQSQHLIAALKERSDKPVKYLLNTHHHGDHSGGNIAFKGVAEHVVAHQNSLKNQKDTAQKQNSVEKQLFPDLTFTDSWKQKVGGESIRMHYFGPGHTNGDSIIHFENANVAHMGDLLFNGRYPFVDMTAGASVVSWVKVLDKTLLTFDNKTLFVFGHAFDPEKVTGSKEEIKLFKDYLEKLITFVNSEIKAGKSKEEVLKATSVPGVTYMQGQGIERSIGAAYDELSA